MFVVKNHQNAPTNIIYKIGKVILPEGTVFRSDATSDGGAIDGKCQVLFAMSRVEWPVQLTPFTILI